jgi:hypothetical protein
VVKNASTLNIVQAKISVLYDVLNGLALDAILDKPRAAERELALGHRHCWRPKDLVIYDRGYPSFDFIYQHIDSKVDCLIRAKSTHSYVVRDFVASGKKSLVTLMYPERELEVINQGRQYDYKVNANLSYGFLKNRVMELLHQKAPLDRVVSELEELFLKHTIPIRNNRSNERNTQKYRYMDKPLVTKNQKDSL